MNRHQLQQYLFNNLWFGENRRARELDNTQPLVTALLQPNYFRPWGLDDSHWGGILDLARAKSLGMSFAFFKGMDGTIETRYFRENFIEAQRLNIPAAPYQWLYRNSNVSCVAQAQAFDNLCNQLPPVLPPVIDFEATRYGGVPSNPDFTDLRKWAAEWLRLGNPKPLLYSGKYYMDGFGQMPADLKDMFAGLWLARYTTTNDPTLPPLPLGWTVEELMYHQWTASGDQNHIAPSSTGKLELDLNYRIGNVVPQLPPPTGGTMKEGVLTPTTTSLRIRSGPAITYQQIGGVYPGDRVYGELLAGWLRIQYIIRASGARADFTEAWCSANPEYITLTDYTPPTEPPPASGAIAIDMTLHADGTITGTWTNA